jgi:hemin uptake protein HemP
MARSIPSPERPVAAPEPKQREPSPPLVRTLDSETLLGSGREVVIRHGNERYILRLTGNNKLILTK